MREPSSSLRIALFTHSVNPRGGVVHTLELAGSLQALGHDVCVFAPAAPGQTLFRHVDCAVELMPLGLASSSVGSDASADRSVALRDGVTARIRACVAHLRHARLRERFDVLHAQDSITGNALAILRASGTIDGFVRTVHHLDEFADPQLAEWQRRAFREADRVLCVSELWRDRLARDEGIDAQPVRNGVDTRRFRPWPDAPAERRAQQDVERAALARLGVDRGDPLLLSVGGVESRKNTVRVAQAFARLHRARPQARWVVAGGASLLDHGAYRGAFDQVLRDGGLSTGPGGAVLLTGPLPDPVLPMLMRRADAVLMPSLNEGFGLVVLEALACATPVVVSRRAPFTEYLSEDDACWADPESVPSIERAIACALGRSMSSPPPVCARYTWSASARRHAALYRALCERTAAAGGPLRAVRVTRSSDGSCLPCPP